MNKNTLLCVTMVFSIAMPLFSMQQNHNADADAACSALVRRPQMVPNGHVPCAGGRLLCDQYNPTTLWLIDCYCQQHQIKRCNVLKGHKDWVSAVAITPDGKQGITGSDDNTVRVLNLKKGVCKHVLNGHEGGVSTFAITHDGKHCIAGSKKGSVRIWNLESNECVGEMHGLTGCVNVIATTPDDKYCVTGSESKVGSDKGAEINIWQRSDCELKKQVFASVNTREEAQISGIAIAPDNTRMISGSSNGHVYLFDLINDFEHCLLQDQPVVWPAGLGGVSALAITRDSKQLLVGYDSGNVRVFDLETKKVVYLLKGHVSNITTIEITPDGERCVVGSSGGTVRVWNLKTGGMVYKLSCHKGAPALALAITPDGKHCVGVFGGNIVLIWNLENGECVCKNESCYREGIVDGTIAIAPDGKHCMTGFSNGEVCVFHFDIPKLLRRALQQLTLAQLTLLMDIYNGVQQGQKSIRVRDIRAYCALPTVVRDLIKPYVDTTRRVVPACAAASEFVAVAVTVSAETQACAAVAAVPSTVPVCTAAVAAAEPIVVQAPVVQQQQAATNPNFVQRAVALVQNHPYAISAVTALFIGGATVMRFMHK